MAGAFGISPSSVGRIWAEAGLKPYLTHGFKVSNDPLFEGIENEPGMRGGADPPANDPPGIGVDNEGDIDEPFPCGDVGEI